MPRQKKTGVKIDPSDLTNLRIVAYLQSRGSRDLAGEIVENLTDSTAKQIGKILTKSIKPRTRAQASLADDIRISLNKPKGVQDNQLFIERNSDGFYAVRRWGSTRASAVEETQSAAISHAKQMDPDAPIHVERVKRVGAGGRDRWRKT